MLNTSKALRVLFQSIVAESGGRFSVYTTGDLARACGLRRGATAEEWAAAALSIVSRWATRPSLRIGDVVAADYFGTILVGRISAYDGSGYCYLEPLAGSFAHNGRTYEGVCLSPDQRRAMFRIGRKAYPSIAAAPYSCLGGCYGSDKAAA